MISQFSLSCSAVIARTSLLLSRGVKQMLARANICLGITRNWCYRMRRHYYWRHTVAAYEASSLSETIIWFAASTMLTLLFMYSKELFMIILARVFFSFFPILLLLLLVKTRSACTVRMRNKMCEYVRRQLARYGTVQC